MTLQTEFETIELADLPAFVEARKAEGWRFVQILAVTVEEGVDLVYSFMKDGRLVNSKIVALPKDAVVPSITGQFLEAFVFENEIHDLFGVHIEGIAIDFEGNFYALAQSEPMTVISPEQKAAREKAKKAEAARKAKEAKAAAEAAKKAAEEQAAAEATSKKEGE